MKDIVGDLQLMSLYNIVESVEVQGKTGQLHLVRGGEEKTFYFEEGAMIFVTSTSPGERFGEFLSASGCLDIQRIETLLSESRRRGERFTADLLAAKVFERKDLEKALGQLVIKALADALEWEEGRFKLSHDLPQGIRTGPVSIRVPHALNLARLLQSRTRGQEVI